MIDFELVRVRSLSHGILVALLLFPFGVRADVEAPALPGPETLADYLRVALKNNPGLVSAHERYKAALEKIPQAKSLPDPRISINHFVESIQTRTGPQNNQFMLGQTLPWFGKLKLRGEIASKEAEAVYHEYENMVLGLVRGVSLGFYDYSYLARETEITEGILKLLAEMEPNVQEKVRGGGDLSQLLRLQVEIGKTRDMLQALQKERSRKSAALRALLGQKSPAELLPWPSPLASSADEPVNRQQLVRALLADNPALQAIEKRIKKAERGVELAKLSPVPDPTLGVSRLDTGAAINPATSGSGDDPWGVQISFSIPLWWGKYKAEKAEAAAMRQQARALLSDTENRLLAELESALQSLTEAQDRIKLYDGELLPIARQAVDIAGTTYKSGKLTILDFIDSERSLLSLEIIYWKAIADAHKSRVRLETLTGASPVNLLRQP
ncbi:MAG: cobalt-zinc-cadmium efflux system outer membrane protein [Verrucomicrobiales bacterium]|jgi:cobalt-zinc-cadmium efflux system outer membrane protein